MYLPLRFLEMMDNYIKLPKNKIYENDTNEKSIKTVRTIMKSHGDFILESYKEILDYLKCNGKIQKDVLNRWEAIKDKYKSKVDIVTELDVDFIDLLTFTDIRANWRQRRCGIYI